MVLRCNTQIPRGTRLDRRVGSCNIRTLAHHPWASLPCDLWEPKHMWPVARGMSPLSRIAREAGECHPGDFQGLFDISIDLVVPLFFCENAVPVAPAARSLEHLPNYGMLRFLNLKT